MTSEHSILERPKSATCAPELDPREAQECQLASQNSILICSRGPLASHISILRDSQRALGVPEFDLETFKRALGGVPEVDLERLKSAIGAPIFDLERLKRIFSSQSSILRGLTSALGAPRFDLERLHRVLDVPEFDLGKPIGLLASQDSILGGSRALLASQNSISRARGRGSRGLLTAPTSTTQSFAS